MKKLINIILSLVAVLTVVSCTQAASAAEVKSDKPRETAPAVSPADMSTLVGDNTDFAINLYQNLFNQGENLFFSPYSISEALAMVYGGARGETETQIVSAMRFQLSQAQLHPAFNSIDIALASRGQGAQGTNGEGFQLNVVNAIWGQKNFKFSASYLDLLAQNYGAGLRVVDFINYSEAARQTINQWVSDQTKSKINDLLPQGSITPLTRLVLTNAIYFNAAWALQFQKENTQDAQFNLLDGSSTTVQMMRQQESFRYFETADFQVVELLYDGNELSMLIVLPRLENFNNFEKTLTKEQLDDISGNLKNSEVNLSLPKFSVTAEFNLKQSLSSLGMPVAFSPEQADFSGIDGARDLYISDVVHKAFITVDEAGTEAAAATGVVVGTTSLPMEVEEMNIDHPFIFLIKDNPTGTILFVGSVINPAN